LLTADTYVVLWENHMFIKSFAMATTGLAMIAAPVAASAAPAGAASLSVAKSVRAGTPVSKKSKLAGESLVPVLIGAGVLAGVTYLVIDKENDDDSDSN
jgi:hypothetical protein